MRDLWHFCAISDPPRSPRDQFRWVQMALTYHPECIPPRPDQDIWSHRSHLWPEMPILWHFRAVYGHKIGIKGQMVMSTNWISTPPDPTYEIKLLVSLNKNFFIFPLHLSMDKHTVHASLVHYFLVLGAIYFWCCVFGAMHCQLYRAGLLPQWRIYFMYNYRANVDLEAQVEL